MSTLFTLKSCVKVNKSLWKTFCWQHSKDITSAYYCLACVKRNYLSLVCCVTCRSCWQKHVVVSEFQLMLRAALISLTWRVIVRTDAPLSSVAVNTCFQLLLYIVQCEPVYNESRHAVSTLWASYVAFGDKCQAPCSSRSPLRLFLVGWTTVTACWSYFATYHQSLPVIQNVAARLIFGICCSKHRIVRKEGSGGTKTPTAKNVPKRSTKSAYRNYWN